MTTRASGEASTLSAQCPSCDRQLRIGTRAGRPCGSRARDLRSVATTGEIQRVVDDSFAAVCLVVVVPTRLCHAPEPFRDCFKPA